MKMELVRRAGLSDRNEFISTLTVKYKSMKTFRHLASCLFAIMLIIAINAKGSAQQGNADKDKSYESSFRLYKDKVSADRISKGVYYLSKDPLPRRVLNYTIPGNKLSTLEEADEWIIKAANAIKA